MNISILSVGPGDPGLLNEQTKGLLCKGENLILRTDKSFLVQWLHEKNIPFSSLDYLYDSASDFDDLSEKAAETVWNSAKKNSSVLYAVSDFISDRTVDLIYKKRPPDGQIRIIPGFSFSDYYFSGCRELLTSSGIQVFSASSFNPADYQPSQTLLITELNDEITAGEIKRALETRLDDEDTVVFFKNSADPLTIPLYELDRQKSYSHLSAIAVGGRPYQKRSRKTINDLMEIMDLLRSPDGCPWDRVQTHESLKPYLIEEAWETADAIDQQDPDHLAEELGDLLFQIVFHVSVGKSFDEFTMDDITTSISDKMIRRHPHVFDTSHSDYSPDNWEKIKRSENGMNSVTESLFAISEALPSLRYAEKMIKKICSFPSMKRSPDQIIQTIQSLSQALNNLNQSGMEKTLKSLLLACAELSFSIGTDSETLLHSSVKNLAQSFQDLEQSIKSGCKAPECLTFNDLCVY